MLSLPLYKVFFIRPNPNALQHLAFSLKIFLIIIIEIFTYYCSSGCCEKLGFGLNTEDYYCFVSQVTSNSFHK